MTSFEEERVDATMTLPEEGCTGLPGMVSAQTCKY